MAKLSRDIDLLKELLSNGKNEDANRPLAYSLFSSLFGKQFVVESDAAGADGYVEGRLLLELKTSASEWLAGLYQGLHYHKLGLSFPYICVLANRRFALWNVEDLPQEVLAIAAGTDSQLPPNQAGRVNSNKTTKALASLTWNSCMHRVDERYFTPMFGQDIDTLVRGSIHVLRNLDQARIQVNSYNFLDQMDLMRRYFDKPLDAIHCFYSIVAYWTIASRVLRVGESSQLIVSDVVSSRTSDTIEVQLHKQDDFRKFVESRYVFTNEGSGITADYYFSRFDEAIARLDNDCWQRLVFEPV